MTEFLALTDTSEAKGTHLFDYSARIASLLEDPKVLANDELTACLDDLLGSVYTLIYAMHTGVDDDRPNRLRAVDITAVRKRARDMSQRKVRTDGKWTAGFYLSNALFRIAAVYHRVLRALTHQKRKLAPLVEIAKIRFRVITNTEWRNAGLTEIHDEVNRLKHKPEGILPGRRAKYAHAEAAIGELLELIEKLN